MTAKELYLREPEKIETDLNILRGFYYNHIPEIDDNCGDYFTDDILKNNKRIKIKILKDFSFDPRRHWRLATIWIDENPVMIIQNAGREYDDFSKRFITNKELYIEMISYIKSLFPIYINEIIGIIDENIDSPILTNFYNNNLDGIFERSKY
jgi:hypothetical protein